MKINNLFEGRKYEEFSQHQREWGNKLISELRLKGNETVLDLGCGNALTTGELAERVPKGKVIGVDWSSSMLDVARSHKIENRIENMELMLIDINKISFNNKFDIVFSNATLHWILNHEKLLENIYSALKNRGFMRIQFGADGNCPHFIETLKEVIELFEFKKYFENFKWPWYMPKLKDYETLLSKTKFRNCKAWGENINYYFPDEKAMIGWIEQPSIIPLIAVLPRNLRDSFRNLVIEKMIEKTKQADGTYLEIFSRINAYAEK